jgi:hemerythrin-like domain-containing protein
VSGPTTPTSVLRDEHRVILKALDVLETASARLAAAEPVPEETWAALVEWLGRFADARHHAKEERVLFPALEAAGLPREGGPIAVMLEEHEAGRALVRDMRAGRGADRAASAREYVRLLRSHIAKENEVLFELADSILDGPAADAVARACAAADRDQDATTDPVAAEAALDRLAAAPARCPG